MQRFDEPQAPKTNVFSGGRVGTVAFFLSFLALAAPVHTASAQSTSIADCQAANVLVENSDQSTARGAEVVRAWLRANCAAAGSSTPANQPARITPLPLPAQDNHDSIDAMFASALTGNDGVRERREAVALVRQAARAERSSALTGLLGQLGTLANVAALSSLSASSDGDLSAVRVILGALATPEADGGEQSEDGVATALMGAALQVQINQAQRNGVDPGRIAAVREIYKGILPEQPTQAVAGGARTPSSAPRATSSAVSEAAARARANNGGACPRTLGYLDSVLPRYADPNLRSVRSAIVGTDLVAQLAENRNRGVSAMQAAEGMLQMAEQSADEFQRMKQCAAQTTTSGAAAQLIDDAIGGRFASSSGPRGECLLQIANAYMASIAYEESALGTSCLAVQQ